MTEALTFRASDHTYWYADQRVPSVTQVLARLGLTGYGPDDPAGWAAERGSAVHAAIHLLELDDLDESSVDPRLTGYLDGYRRFVAETSAGPCELLEEPLGRDLGDPCAGYAGTPDQARWLRIGHHDRLALIDLKTGAACEWHWLQLAGYVGLLRDRVPALPMGTARLVRAALYLHDNGTYRLAVRTAKDALVDDRRWAACLEVDAFRRRYPVWRGNNLGTAP